MRRFKGQLWAGTVIAGLFATDAVAQQAAPAAPVAADTADGSALAAQDASIPDIIVTAQRRTEVLQNVPASVTALSGDEILKRGLTDIRDVLAQTPGATFTSFNAAEPILSIRGISSGGEGAASDSGVLMMIDGEVISRDFMRAVPIFDVERVEVLRGPQGTTYGRNATGGVFHLITRKPSDRTGGEARVEAGNYGAVKLDAGFDNVIGPDTRYRVAFQFARRDGYFQNVATGKDLDDRLSLAGRLTLVHDFSSTVTTTLRVHGSRERHGDTTPLKSADPTLPIIKPPFSPPVTETTSDPYKVITSPGGSFFDRDVWGVSNELFFDFGPVALTSLTAYRNGDNTFFQSSPLAYNNLNVRNKAEVFSQEVRLEGGAPTDRLYWVAGLFFLNEEVQFGFDRFGAAATNFGPTTLRLRQTSSGRGYGIFGEIKYEVIPSLTLTLGGRYSRDEKSFSLDSRAQGPFANFFVEGPDPLIASVRDSWGKPTGRASLQYRPSEAFMVYGSVSQGYKSGGFNSEPTNLVAATTPFNEETVLNLEAGIRSQLFDRRLRLNVTGFRMKYNDIQISAFNANSVEITSNAASATIKGIEVEAVARPIPNLSFSLGGAAYDAKFDRYVDTSGTDLAGTRLARSPRWTLTASAVADSPVIGDAGRFQLRADYATRSSVANDAPADLRFGIREGKDLLDLSLSWTPLSNEWGATLFVRNVLDQAENQYVFPQGILSQRFVSYGPPRTFGASVFLKY